MKEAILTIDGMTCDNCARHVQKSLKSVKGVSNAEVFLDENQARVSFNPSKVDLSSLHRAVEDVGYRVV